MRKKKGLTLIELMASLAIFFIFLSVVSGAFFKSYNLNIKNEKMQIVQDEYRNAIMAIKSNVENKEKADYSFYVYNEGKKCSVKNEDMVDIYNGIPLISIVPKSLKGGSIFTYVVTEKAEGSSITKYLEEIEVDSVNNMKAFESEDIQENNFIIIPKAKKTLINNVNSVTAIRNNDDNNLINMYFKVNVWKNKTREYETSMKLYNNKEIVINIEDNNGEEAIPPITDEEITDLINALGENNLNILGQDKDSVESKYNGLEIGTIGGGSIGYNHLNNEDINKLKDVIRQESVGLNNNTKLKKIKFKSDVYSDIIIYGDNNIEGTPLYKESVKTEQPGIVAEIILVNGDVIISPPKNTNNVAMTKTVIVATGDIIFHNSFNMGIYSTVNMTDCILYGAKLKANINGAMMIDNSYWFTPPKGILRYDNVRLRLSQILKEYLL